MNFALHRLLLPGLALAASAGVAEAQQSVRYFITARPEAGTPHDALTRDVALLATVNPQDPEARPGILADVNFPQYRFSGVAANLTADKLGQLDPARYEIRRDFPLLPNSGPAGPVWALDQFCLPDPAGSAENVRPVVYVVDTGIDPSHTELTAYPGAAVLDFPPGLSYGYDTSVTPPVLRNPLQDPLDHGTRMAGCLGGITTGLLGPLGGRASVKSVVIYDIPATGPPATFVSQAISGILGSTADHQSRRALPYLKNHAGVILFAHSTTVAAGRFADLDRAIEIAWEEGLHVVMSAGNEGADAVLVSPAGAAWGYQNGGTPVRFWYGTPPAGAVFYRAADEFMVTGAYQMTPGGIPGIWPASNQNAIAAAVDAFSPGLLVPCPVASPPGGMGAGAGTSYSAALTAALTTWVVGQRPWATPVRVRKWLCNARTAIPGGLRWETPALPPDRLTYADWIHHFLPVSPGLPGNDAPMADPDSDGLPNFMEYYCGLDPRFDDREFAPELTAVVNAGTVDLRISLPKASWLGEIPQVNWSLQRSSDLQTWTPVTLTSFQQESPSAMADGLPWEAEATVTLTPGQEYFRLSFTASGPLL